MDNGGSDVFVDRTGIMLGGGMTARFGNGLTSFDTSVLIIASCDVVATAPLLESMGSRVDSDIAADGFARGVLKLNGIGTVGIVRPTPGVVDLSSALGR